MTSSIKDTSSQILNGAFHVNINDGPQPIRPAGWHRCVQLECAPAEVAAIVDATLPAEEIEKVTTSRDTMSHDVT